MGGEGLGMDISLNNAKAQKVWTDKENLWLLLVDGRRWSRNSLGFFR